jgi:general stress protein 26
MTRPSSEVQAELDAAHQTLRCIRGRLSELKAERAMLEKDENAYLDTWNGSGTISKLKRELTRSKAVELSYSVKAIPVVFTGDPDPDYVVAKVTAKQIHCCKRDGSSGLKTDLTGKTGRKTIDMQATFGKGSVEPNSIKTGIVIEDKQ